MLFRLLLWAVSLHPYYLPRVFRHVIVVLVAAKLDRADHISSGWHPSTSAKTCCKCSIRLRRHLQTEVQLWWRVAVTVLLSVSFSFVRFVLLPTLSYLFFYASAVLQSIATHGVCVPFVHIPVSNVLHLVILLKPLLYLTPKLLTCIWVQEVKSLHLHCDHNDVSIQRVPNGRRMKRGKGQWWRTRPSMFHVERKREKEFCINDQRIVAQCRAVGG